MLRSLFKNKYGSNLIWTFVEKFLSLISVLIIGVLLARYLGPEKFGVLSYSQSFVAMFSFLISLGLDGIIVREIVKAPHKTSAIISTSFSMKIIALLGVILLINLLSFRFNDEFEIKLIISIISLNLLKEPFNVFANYFQAIVKIQKISLVIIISKIALIILKLLLLIIMVVGFLEFYQEMIILNFLKLILKPNTIAQQKRLLKILDSHTVLQTQ